MSSEQNKALVLRLIEGVMNDRDVGLIDQIIAPDFVEHEEIGPGITPDRAGTKQVFSMMLSAFPDFKATVEDIIAEGDKVAVRMTWSGTQEGQFMDIPPSGNRFSISVFDMFLISNGQIAAHWGQSDMMGMMQQLGVMPGPGEG